jgi:hypothetical protein
MNFIGEVTEKGRKRKNSVALYLVWEFKQHKFSSE